MSGSVFIDLTHSLGPRPPVFPGDDPAGLVQVRRIERDGFCDFRLETGLHVGTHLDGAMHRVAGRSPLSSYPLERFVGRGQVIDCSGRGAICLLDQEAGRLAPGDFVLFYTGHDRHYGAEGYFTEHPVMTPECAAQLIARGVGLVGLDTPSPDRPPYAIHQALLGADVLILENLTRLQELLGATGVRVFALPIKVEADSALVRAIAELPVGDRSVLA